MGSWMADTAREMHNIVCYTNVCLECSVMTQLKDFSHACYMYIFWYTSIDAAASFEIGKLQIRHLTTFPVIGCSAAWLFPVFASRWYCQYCQMEYPSIVSGVSPCISAASYSQTKPDVICWDCGSHPPPATQSRGWRERLSCDPVMDC